MPLSNETMVKVGLAGGESCIRSLSTAMEFSYEQIIPFFYGFQEDHKKKVDILNRF